MARPLARSVIGSKAGVQRLSPAGTCSLSAVIARGWLFWLTTLARLMAGGMYLAGGLVPFLHWAYLPMPSPDAGQFMAALVDSDMLKVSKSLEVIFGVALLANLWVPLSLAVLAPVLFFIAWVDWYIDPFPGGIIAVAVLAVSHLFLMWVHRRAYLPMLVRKVKP